MSLWEKPADPVDWRPMGGEATLAEIVASSFEAGRLAHSAIAESESIEQAFDERIDAIRAATGQSLANPYREALPRSLTGRVHPFGAPLDTPELYAAKVQDDWQRQLNSLAEKFPEHFDAIAPGRSILDDAGAIRRRAEEASAAQFESRGGLAKYGAAFAGGFGAFLRDPVQVSMATLGGGVGAVRTIGGRILQQAVVGAGTNAATEAAVQPFVQSGREKAGLPSGVGPALADIGMAGLFGAVLSGGMQGAGELLGAVAKRAGRAPEDLPDDVRGAVAAIEADQAMTATRPAQMPAEMHDGVAAAAIAAAEDPARIADAIARTESAAAEIAGAGAAVAEPPVPDGYIRVYHSGSAGQGGENDGRWVSTSRRYASDYRPGSPLHYVDLPANDPRVNNPDYADQGVKNGFTFNFELTPVEATRLTPIQREAAGIATPPRRTFRVDPNAPPVSLFRFLGAAGGLRDHGGELKAMGLEKTLTPGHGRLVRQKGLDLDHAREIAAEAGYLDAKYGTPEQAMAQSTVADLLDLLSEEAGGRRVFTLADQARAAELDNPDRAKFEARRRRVDKHLGESVAPAIRERVTELVHFQKMKLDDALERAIMEDYYAGGDVPVRAVAGGQEHEVPFFDDDPVGAGNAGQRAQLPGEGDGPDPFGGGSRSPFESGDRPRVSGTEPGSAAGSGASGELSEALALPEASPFEPVTAGDPQTEALLATIEDPAGITIADGVTLQSELDDVRHMEGMAGLVDACRLL